jgi:sec-independent protein translocase protein TatC
MKLYLARRPTHPDNPAEDGDDVSPALSLLRHLDDLRRRIIYAAIAVGAGMLIAFAFIMPIFDFVFQPIRSVLPANSKLIYTQPGEAFSVYVQIALIAGVVFASPFVMYQVWRLVAPVLYQKQHRRFAIAFVMLTSLGFVSGALFNHFILFRWMIAFFASFNTGTLAFMPRLDDVFGLYTKMLFGMGLVFQMPAIVYFLAKMGLVSGRFLLRQFKYAFLLIFIAAAVITPSGDAATQALFAAPMIGLYLIGIVIAWIVGPVAGRGPFDDEEGGDA